MIRSRGLADAGLCEVEISDCPVRLQDVARNLVLQIALNGKKNPESLAEGKVIGGRFVNARQPLIEVFRLVRRSDEASVLRIVDLHDIDLAFPQRLVATHLCATAGSSRNDSLRLLLVAIEVWPKERMASNALLGDYEFNPNNFWSWIDLGTTVLQAKCIDQTAMYWKTGVCMWPRGGKLYANKMLTRLSSKAFRDNTNRFEQEFWQSVTNETIRAWCTELNVSVSEETLAN